MKILSGHNSDQLPIGKPLEMHEDARGLYIKAQISDTHMGRDVKTLLRDGVLNELSIGFDADPSDCRVDEFGVRHLYKLKLWEVSVVTWAMNSSAVITDYKAQVPEAIVKQVDPLPAIQPSAPPPSRAAYKRVAKMYTRC
ncbi:hypothetical protein AGMMS49992_24300 [Clostridia bacterium]|nr:hypothetical protein AGMMS49992_24300 [Clostridia bacterium]